MRGGFVLGMSNRPTGVTAELARAIAPVLDLLLAQPGIDHDTERRTEWLRTRLVEIAPDLAPPLAPAALNAGLLHLEQFLLTG